MRSFTLNIRGGIREISRPLVMGILNVTPDSFYDGSRTLSAPLCQSGTEHDGVYTRVSAAAATLLSEGADIIDIGGCSTRPGSAPVTPEEEAARVALGLRAVRELSEDVMVSVDTFRAAVAVRAVEEWGADIVNDISAGLYDKEMIPAVAHLGVPYIMMHMRGVPDTMQRLTDYPDGVVAGVASELQARIAEANAAGIGDIIIDPGLGFAKTVAQNYELLQGLPVLSELLGNRPMLIGLSRKSMIYKPLGISPAEALPATIALDTIALASGAAIIRVHDVAPAQQTIRVMELLQNS